MHNVQGKAQDSNTILATEMTELLIVNESLRAQQRIQQVWCMQPISLKWLTRLIHKKSSFLCDVENSLNMTSKTLTCEQCNIKITSFTDKYTAKQPSRR